MRKVRVAALVAVGCGVLIGCSTFRDQSKAMVGGGAVAGQDYINGLTPSEKARTYFTQNASDESSAVTISRTGDGENNTGVRFVANGGVVIPPGASITFENQGYCCDPHLPAPKAGDEYQFVKTTQLIPEELQSIYRKLLTKASNGDEATLKNMQKLVWALRTAGTEAGYANNLTDQQKKILNSCSEYEGEFELYCSEKLAWSRFWKKLLAQADSYTTINIGGVTYQASDLLDDNVGEKKIKEHLGQLITLGESMPVEHNGFNYGELASGIYTDIKGTGPLKFKATVANSTTQNFTFYPMDYIAQVGSGVSDESASVVYFATASSTQKQRVTIIPQDEVEVEECDHVWKAINKETNSTQAETLQSNLDNKKELRDNYKSQIDEKRQQIADEILNMEREDGMEYGTIIYLDSDGHSIRSLPITVGNRDWVITYDNQILQRTTIRNGKYYVYDGNKLGREVSSKWGDHEMHWSYGWLSGKTCVPQRSWPVPSVPDGCVALEIVHLHPEYSSFSPEDLFEADKSGVAISVINQGAMYSNGRWFTDDRVVTYEPSDGSYHSTLDDLDETRKEHTKRENERDAKYSYICVRCGRKK